MVIGSCAGDLYVLDREHGTVVWSYSTAADASEAQFHGDPVAFGDSIIVPTDADPQGYLYAFNAQSGEVLWKLSFPGGIGTTPIIAGNRMFVVAADGGVHAIDLRDGKILWNARAGGSSTPVPRMPSPAARAGTIFVADNAGTVRALDQTDGHRIWERTLPDRVNTSLVATGANVIAGTAGGTLYQIDAKSGRIRRSESLGAILFGTPISIPPKVLILERTDKSHLIAFDISKGKTAWERATDREWTTFRPLILGGTVVAGNESHSLCAFRTADGKPEYCMTLDEVPRGLGKSPDETELYVGTLSGKVIAFRKTTLDH